MDCTPVTGLSQAPLLSIPRLHGPVFVEEMAEHGGADLLGAPSAVSRAGRNNPDGGHGIAEGELRRASTRLRPQSVANGQSRPIPFGSPGDDADNMGFSGELRATRNPT